MDHSHLWTKQDPSTGQKFLISTRRDWVDEKFVQDALASDQVYWAGPMTTDALKLMLDNSLTFSLFLQSSPTDEPSPSNLKQIGIGRAVTDHVTILYLTDVFILPEYQGNGLGNWLVGCLKEASDEMRERGSFRRFTLITGRGSRTEKFYRRALDMESGEEMPGLVFLTTKKRF